MLKLIATDMDGTFLTDDKKFDPSFYELFEEMKRQGITFVIASGNQHAKLYEKFPTCKDELYYISDNGGHIAHGLQGLHDDVMSDQSVGLIIDALEEIEDVVTIVCGTKGAYALVSARDYEHEVAKYYGSYYFIDDYSQIDDKVVKVAVFDKKAQAMRVNDELRANLPTSIRVVTSGNEWVDVQNTTAHKGVGLAFLQEKLGIKKEECAAFGDQMNDYELLQQAKYSYAMSNAIDPIKEIALEVIGSNEQQAVLTKIKELLELNTCKK